MIIQFLNSMNNFNELCMSFILKFVHLFSVPEFLEEYIDTEPMQKQAGISVSCGTVYSKMFDELWYSSLDHSVAVALIV